MDSVPNDKNKGNGSGTSKAIPIFKQHQMKENSRMEGALG